MRKKNDKTIETDVREHEHLNGSYRSIELDDHVGKIRREFMSACVTALIACPDGGYSYSSLWDFAESALLEGQLRGYLP